MGTLRYITQCRVWLSANQGSQIQLTMAIICCWKKQSFDSLGWTEISSNPFLTSVSTVRVLSWDFLLSGGACWLLQKQWTLPSSSSQDACLLLVLSHWNKNKKSKGKLRLLFDKNMNSMQTFNTVTFISWKKSFSDISRKCTLPNMIWAVTGTVLGHPRYLT